MNKFNLTVEPWITCLLKDGNLRELNLRETLIRSHEISEIVDDSPLVFLSLHRFLLSILHRNFGPRNFEEWKSLWRRGHWDAEVLNEYLQNWRNRFNLFDDEFPFYQYPRVLKSGDVDADIVPVSILMQERAGGNNATLFDHSHDLEPSSYASTLIARYLIARQAFSIGFGKSHPFYFSDSPAIRGLSLLNTGRSLFETLALNLVIYHRDKPIPRQDDSRFPDIPFWERATFDEATEMDHQGTVPRGYLDYLTWQSRRIKLFPENEGATVSRCQIQQNFKLGIHVLDPFKTYKSDDDTGWKACQIVPDKTVWRDSHTLLSRTGTGIKQAEILSIPAQVWLARQEHEIDAQNTYSLSVIGLTAEVGKAANVLLWTYDRLPLPLRYLEDDELLGQLRTAMEFAEDISKHLDAASQLFALRLIWKPAGAVPEDKEKPSSKDWKKAKELAKEFDCVATYWSALEVEFNKLLLQLAISQKDAMKVWLGKVITISRKAIDEELAILAVSKREQKAFVYASEQFEKRFRETRQSVSLAEYF